MRLHTGDEFRDPSPGQGSAGCPDRPVYRVTGVVAETPWMGLYEGIKLFHNYHFGKRSLELVTPEEGLHVWLKTLHYPRLDDRKYINERREHADFEMSRVLGRMRRRSSSDEKNEPVVGRPLSNLFPEPIDRLQVLNDRDVFAIANVRQLIQYERVLVLERVHGISLRQWRESQQPSPVVILEVLAHLLEFLGSAHLEGLLLTGLCPDAVWIGQGGRLHYLASEMVIEAAAQQKQRPLFPSQRYPRGCCPPESFHDGPLDTSADLFNWAALAYHLLTGEDPADFCSPERPSPVFTSEHFDRLRGKLAAVPCGELKHLQEDFHLESPRFLRTWPDSFVAVLRACVNPDRAGRPASPAALGRQWLASVGAEPRRKEEETCPQCAAVLGKGQLSAHLRDQHGYVELLGEGAGKKKTTSPRLLPLAEALRELWLRLLVNQDARAAAQLAGLFVQRHGERAVTAYAAALEQQLQLQSEALGAWTNEAQPPASWVRLGQCLAGHELTQRLCHDLLMHPRAQMRQLARLALVPATAPRLRGKTSAAAFRTALEALCPGEDGETRLLVCAQLVAAGAARKPASIVAEQLRREREQRQAEPEQPSPQAGPVETPTPPLWLFWLGLIMAVVALVLWLGTLKK